MNKGFQLTVYADRRVAKEIVKDHHFSSFDDAQEQAFLLFPTVKAIVQTSQKGLVYVVESI